MPQNRKYEITKRRSEIAELYLKCVPQFKIAEKLGVSTSQVSRDLKKVNEQWIKAAQDDIDIIKSRELAKIDRIENEAWEAWMRSCEERVRKYTKQKGSGKKDSKTGKPVVNSVEQSNQTEQQVGDSRFLAIIQNCITQREKILGYGAASKVDITSKGDKVEGGTIIILPANGREVEVEEEAND